MIRLELGQWRYNSDGIDICASSNTVVKNCFIRTFDDCFVARGAFLWGEEGGVSNVVVENCIMWCDWGKALEIWCGERDCCISNIRFRNIDVIHTVDCVISITSAFGSPATLVRDVEYDGIFVEGEAFYPRTMYQVEDCPDFPVCSDETIPKLICCYHWQLGRNLGNQQCGECSDTSYIHMSYRDIAFKNIFCRNRKLPCRFECDPGILDMRGILLENVEFSSLLSDGVVDLNVLKISILPPSGKGGFFLQMLENNRKS